MLSKASRIRKLGWKPLAGIMVLVVIALLFGGSALEQQYGQSPGLTWGPVQSGVIASISACKTSACTVFSVSESSSTILFIRTASQCLYKLGDPIQYQISSFDSAIGTQRIRLVSPAWLGCEALSPT